MKVVLWNTGRTNVCNPLFERGTQRRFLSSFRSRREFVQPDRFPVDPYFAQLASTGRPYCERLVYCLDIAPTADLFVLVPTLESLPVQLDMIKSLGAARPRTQIWAVGSVAVQYQAIFADYPATVIAGNASTIWQRLKGGPTPSTTSPVDGFTYPDDAFPEWDLFDFRAFRDSNRFTAFPTCALNCDASQPAEWLVEQIEYGHHNYGFRSVRIQGECIDRNANWLESFSRAVSAMDSGIQFSCRLSRPMEIDCLQLLKRKGLRHVDLMFADLSEQSWFVAACRQLGLQTSAHYSIEFGAEQETVKQQFDLARETPSNQGTIVVIDAPWVRRFNSTTMDVNCPVRFEFDPGHSHSNTKRLMSWFHRVRRLNKPAAEPARRAA